MQIKSSTEWKDVRIELNLKVKELPFNPDLRRLLRAIDSMVSELSVQEVICRRRNTVPTEQLKKVNDAIKVFEQWLMTAALLQ